MKRRAEESIGERFGRLVVLSIDPSSSGSGALARARCDCGQEKTVLVSRLRSGNTQSCGCLARERSGENLPPSMRGLTVEIDGQIQKITAVAKAHGIKGSTLRMRLRAGWDPLKACTAPPEETAHQIDADSERQRAIKRGARASVGFYIDAKLLDEIDAHLDGGSRSAWIEDAVREKLAREKLTD